MAVMAVAAKRTNLQTASTTVIAVIFVIAVISAGFLRRKLKDAITKIRELETSIGASLERCSAERKGRIRCQQALRNWLASSSKLETISYPMTPIGVIQSCFSTRNGTPRQPLLVPLARACLIFDSTRVPPASFEGLEEFSYCWVIYVFHLNTDLEKLWKHSSKSKFKAKVRVPRLKGGRMGVFATRSPHRQNPIGLTVARVFEIWQRYIGKYSIVEGVKRNVVLLSGVDLVDGTPVLDIKPYLPYCDSIQGARVPDWVKDDNMLAAGSVGFSPSFYSALVDCWTICGKKSLYASPEEFQGLIKQVLSWDIRSPVQRLRAQNALEHFNASATSIGQVDGSVLGRLPNLHVDGKVIYHVILEGLDICYTMEDDGNVIIKDIAVSSTLEGRNGSHCDYYALWQAKQG